MRYIGNPVPVVAFKIAHVGHALDDGSRILTLATDPAEDMPAFRAEPSLLVRYVPQAGDYWVQQSDGYIYLNPKSVFERKYRPDEAIPVHSLFQTHSLNRSGLANLGYVRQRFTQLLLDLEQVCPPSREFSLVRTKLEEACMYSIKSICMDSRNAAYPDPPSSGMGASGAAYPPAAYDEPPTPEPQQGQGKMMKAGETLASIKGSL